MVSIFEGQLSRTWFLSNKGRNHVVGLYHDPITGVRTATLDYQEIRGSEGNSSLLMDSKGHRIFFTVDNLPSYIEIKRSGWTGFSYACVVNNVRMSEATETVAINQEALFYVKIVETTLTEDEMNADYPITWFRVKSERIKDKVVTHVHRRFREFAELNSQVKQNFKGHHLRAALPPFPEKTPKLLVNYQDPDFIRQRQVQLENYLQQLLAIPHVSNMLCVKAFLGLMAQVREFSISFHVPTLGLTLQPSYQNNPSTVQGNNTPNMSGGSVVGNKANNGSIVVDKIHKPELCDGVVPGDALSKINGVPVSGSPFAAVVQRIKTLPRPLIVHFIQVMTERERDAEREGETVFVSPSLAVVAEKETEREPDGYVSLSVARPPQTHTHTHNSPHDAHTQHHTRRAHREEEEEEVPDELTDVALSRSHKTESEWNTYVSSAPHTPLSLSHKPLSQDAHSELFGSDVERERETTRRAAFEDESEREKEKETSLPLGFD